MRKTKTYIKLFIILLVFFIVMFLIFGINNIKQSNYQTTLLIGNNTIWNYNKNKWINISTRDSIEKLNWKEYNIYLDNKEFGKYFLWHDDKWYAFDKNKNAVKLDGNLLAYKANFKMKFLDFSKKQITDRTYVDYVLEENDLSLFSQFTAFYKFDIDFDNDKNLEEFFIISNAFPFDFNPEKIFSIVFMVKNNKVYYLYNDISNNRESLNGCKPYLNAVLDTNNDKTYEIILSCARYSVSESIDMLYKFDKEKDAFKIVISNQ